MPSEGSQSRTGGIQNREKIPGHAEDAPKRSLDTLRGLKDSMQNEPERTWNKEMHALFREMIHYRNSLEPGTECSPPSEYYKKGYSLYVRLGEYMHNHLLFLHDSRVPAANNEAERLLRGYKRKQQQAVSFRSFEIIEYLCECMSILDMMRQEE